MSVDSPELRDQGLTLDKLGREFVVIQEEIRTEMVVYKKAEEGMGHFPKL
jgi:hypothetical protein